jgi:tetratricopeptide (TPR) repeat protein
LRFEAPKNRVYLKDFSRNYQLSGFINFSSDDEDANIEYLYNIGLSHTKRGNPRDAIFYFDKVLEVEPGHVNALANKGNVLGKLGKYDQAITCYDIILKDNPEHTTCLLNKGLALHYLERYTQATMCYDKILSNFPEDSSALYHKACTKSLQKEFDQSLELLEKAIRIDEQYAKKASMDKDFDGLCNDSRFKSLVV